MTGAVDISIVVCTLNRAEMLRRCLASLLRQRTDDAFTYEVIVVDNGSTDHTRKVVEQSAANMSVDVSYVVEPCQGIAHARNRGLAEVRGEWIASFDDDQIAELDWLTELLATAREKKCRSVGGAIRLLLPDGHQRQLAPEVRRLLGESVGWTETRRYTPREGPGAGNQMLHRSVFEQAGRYDPAYALRGEDTDLYRRIRLTGIDSWYTPRAVGHHITPPSRLSEDYLRITSQRNGWCFARRDREKFGWVGLAALTVARTAHATAHLLPRAVGAWWRRDQERLLGVMSLWWKTRGYLACAAHLILPRWIPSPDTGATTRNGETSAFSHESTGLRTVE